MFDILAPFIYGSVVAYLLRPMCNFYEGLFADLLPRRIKKAANGLAVGFSLITGILVVYTLLIMILPQLYHSILNLWNSLPDKVSGFITWVTATFGEDEELLRFIDTAYKAVYTELDAWAKNTLAPYVTNIVSGVGSSVIKILMFLYNLLIGLIVAVYLLARRKKFARQSVLIVRSALKPKWADMFLAEVAFLVVFLGSSAAVSVFFRPRVVFFTSVVSAASSAFLRPRVLFLGSSPSAAAAAFLPRVAMGSDQPQPGL